MTGFILLALLPTAMRVDNARGSWASFPTSARTGSATRLLSGGRYRPPLIQGWS